MNKPNTRTDDTVDLIHGVKVKDQYRWLEYDTQEVKEWVKSQNEYTESILKEFPLREKIENRYKELFNIDAVGIPVSRGDRYFFTERKKGFELSDLYVQDTKEGKPRLLIDINSMSKETTSVLDSWVPSPNGKLLVYGISEASNDMFSLQVMDVDTGERLSDFIPAEVYPNILAWSPQNNGFWYLRRNIEVPKGEEKFHKKIYFHELGQNYSSDKMIFGDSIAKEDIPYIVVSEDGRYLAVTVWIYSEAKIRSELYLLDNNNPNKGFVRIVKNKDIWLVVSLHRNTLYVHTNYQAPKWKILSQNLEKIDQNIDEWTLVIPEGEHTINGLKLVQDKLIVEFLENAHSTLKIYSTEGTFIEDISLPTIGSVLSITSERESNELFFSFSSYAFPKTIYNLNINDNSLSIFKQSKVNIDFDKFEITQKWSTSADGTKIPMFIVHKRGITLDGNNPVLLYGYGGFNVSLSPVFSTFIVPFIEHGGIYVETNLRGGGEFGEEWYKAGTKEKKQNVFDDFISSAEWLIANKYTNSSRLAIFGWSNGGLLVGAAIIQRPELFKVAVIGAPVLDMLRYHKFFGGSLWGSDYGSADNLKDFKYLYKYSPYHNIDTSIEYPSTMILTADKDDRVHPMHAYKMAALLQKQSSGDRPVILRIETQAGHGGAASVTKSAQQYTDELSFIFQQLDMSSGDSDK